MQEVIGSNPIFSTTKNRPYTHTGAIFEENHLFGGFLFLQKNIDFPPFFVSLFVDSLSKKKKDYANICD